MLKSLLISGKIVLLSGLHIGGNKETIHIGGIDDPVIKNPVTNLPYIPGSSLKGKTRFLLEHYLGLVNPNDNGRIPPYSEENIVAVIFGHAEHKVVNTSYPTRVVFHDGNLIGALDSEGNLDTDINAINQRIMTDFVEAKTEVVIDRLKGSVGSSGPRVIERVPAGVVFDFSLSLRVFKNEEKDEHLDILKMGLRLLENDALGGSGSRGSGRIQFRDLTIDGDPFDLTTVEL